MVSVMQKSNEWSLSAKNTETFSSSDNEKLFLADSVTSSTENFLKPGKMVSVK